MKRHLNHFDIIAAKRAYKDGINITEILRSQQNLNSNTPEIIETAYDLQAGSYIKAELNKPNKAHGSELAGILDDHVTETASLLDIGTGELTTLSNVLVRLKNMPKAVYACDISWSRIYKGIAYAKGVIGINFKPETVFVADINEIPLLDKSVNITTSSHALEPNGGKLEALMSELFRVTKDKLVLFEPCYEINTEDGQRRMEKLGYIKNIDGVVDTLGGKVTEKIRIKNLSNPLNPTVCFIIIPPANKRAFADNICGPQTCFSVPGTNLPLKKVEDYYFSDQVGLCYPTLKGVPILKSNTAIMASALCE